MQVQTSTASLSSSDPLTISILNRIFDFAAANAEDAILRLGLVSQQWKDALLYSPAMWHRLIVTKWPAQTQEAKIAQATKTTTSRLWSMQSYKMRVISGLRPHHGAKDFADIENCPTPDFEFVCPMVAQNLRVLQNEVNPKNGLNIMFCDVCEKKVYPVTNPDEVRDASSQQRCVIMPAHLKEAIDRSHSTTVSALHEVINVAVVVSKNNYCFDRKDLVTSNINDLGVSTLREIYRHFQRLISPEPPAPVRDGPPPPPLPVSPFDINVKGQMAQFISRNALTIYLDRPVKKYSLNFRVVYVNPPPRLDNDEAMSKLKNSDHPAWDGIDNEPVKTTPSANANDDIPLISDTDGAAAAGISTERYARQRKIREDEASADLLARLEANNPLGIAPANGGFKYVLCADEDASAWFMHPKLLELCKGTQLYALAKKSTQASASRVNMFLTATGKLSDKIPGGAACEGTCDDYEGSLESLNQTIFKEWKKNSFLEPPRLRPQIAGGIRYVPPPSQPPLPTLPLTGSNPGSNPFQRISRKKKSAAAGSSSSEDQDEPFIEPAPNQPPNSAAK